MLALPGGAYLYQGEELGLPDSTDMPHEFRQDPAFRRTNGEEIGRDGCRVPMPWAKDAPSFGFGPTESAWLPSPRSTATTPWTSRRVSRAPRSSSTGPCSRHAASGTSAPGASGSSRASASDVVAFENTGSESAGSTLVVANLGAEPVALPEGTVVLLASGPLDADGRVPTDTTVWATR